MKRLRFCDDFATAVKNEDLSFVEEFYLTNTVMHSSALPRDAPTQRARFYGRPYSSRGATPLLRLLSNDDTPTHNYRIDSDGGRFLSFTRDGNHIRAGKHSPADAVLSMYQYFAEMLQENADGGAYLDAVTVPNLVATGTFATPPDRAFAGHGLVNSSSKFPGKSISLSTGYVGIGAAHRDPSSVQYFYCAYVN